jgi:phosphatidylglycerol---prolipoprotein diacylglyceryl transferase
MYTLSFLIGYIIFTKRKTLKEYELDSLLIYLFFGVVLGWRLWYILFYDLHYYLNNISAIVQVWKWWMSFHGWLIGVITSVYIFSKNYKIQFWKIIDELAAIIPIGLWLGRIGNYINKELLWFPYNWPLAVEIAWNGYFPSPLLEAFLEGFILFFILWYIQKKKTFLWQTSAFFLIIYGIFRIIVEVFFRLPDEKIWYILGPLSLWAVLSIPMIILWIFLLIKYSSPTKKYS